MEILVIEDEAAIREVEAAYLKKAGYGVREAADGQTGWELFKQHGGDLVLIDINIPGLDGLTLCQHIRRIATVPIVIVTAKDGDDDELHGLEAGADDYIKKPFNPDILVARVNTLLKRHTNKRLIFGDLVIDPQQMIVTKKEQTIQLTTTQFNLLFALATHPNVVLTRNELIDHVYSDPAGHDIYDRTIDAHIKSIRKAIEDDVSTPTFIQTVIGKGYRFIPI